MSPMTDEALTEILGPKCPDCGHRRQQHRQRTAWQDPCPALREEQDEDR